MQISNTSVLNQVLLSFSLCFCIAGTSCSRQHVPQNTKVSDKQEVKRDYSNLAHWAAHPWKQDPSDSISASIRANYKKDSLADVFFLYPTSLTAYSDVRWNADIEDGALNSKTDLSSILYQASAFAEKTRLFSPRYRQAHIKSYYSADTLMAKSAFNLAYADVSAAFQHYLTYYNKGRPIIIASHSQGTNHAIRLLKQYFDNKPLQQQLICAYLIGMPVLEKEFNTIQPCRDSTDTGCFTSWRTYQKGFIDQKYVASETFKAVVTNPLLWTTSTEYAPHSLNKGGVLKNYNKVIQGVTDAQVYGNILWSSKPRFFGNIFLTLKNYHIADINFFYMNIKENVETRISMYKRKRL